MIRAKDRMVADVKRVRREISRRLLAARRRGRLHEELTALEREGERACRDASKPRRGV
jgi:hypothetical protein